MHRAFQFPPIPKYPKQGTWIDSKSLLVSGSFRIRMKSHTEMSLIKICKYQGNELGNKELFMHVYSANNTVKLIVLLNDIYKSKYIVNII